MSSIGIKNTLGQVKKRKQNGRVRFTEAQYEQLEILFAEKYYPSTLDFQDVSRKMDVTEKKVRKWFQHRRDKNKRDSTKASSPAIRQAKTSNHAFIPTQETQANAELTAANKENTAPNVSEMRKVVSENQVREISSFLNLRRERHVMQQYIVQYERVIPFDEM